MINQGILRNSAFHSIIGEFSILAPETKRMKRVVNADLLLTALIDAFSILVIFLLMSFSSSGEIIVMGKGMELPKAVQGELIERTPIVKIEEGKIFLDDKEVATENLTAALLDVRKTFLDTHPGEEFPAVLTVQGDRRLKYETLNGIVLASSQAGFSDIKFAVIMK
jgi:biopolymer transport protein ExbD